MFSKDEFQNEIEIYKRFMQINGVSSLLCTFLAIYMIFYRSTPQMAQYKWYLFWITSWSAALDIYTAIIYIPTFMFPTIGICSNGWFGSVDNFRFKEFQFVSYFNVQND